MSFWSNIFGTNRTNKILEKVSRTAILNTRYGSAKWTPDDYYNFVKETYKKNVIAYRAMFYVAQSISSVPWKLYRKEGEEIEIVQEHPLNDLLRRPNPDQSWAYFMLADSVYLQASGNCFIERININESVNQFPKEVYSLRPDKMHVVLDEDTGTIKEYVYDNEIPYPVDPISHNADILQVSLFDPLDEFWGMSPINPTMRELDTSNEMVEWQKKVMENDAIPSMLFMFKDLLSDKQFDRLERQLKEKHTGSDNARRAMIIEGTEGKDVKPYAWSPAELDFLESNRELSRKISLGFGVPPILLGIPGESTYRNYETARLIFWEDTVVFYLNLYRSEFNNWFFGQDNVSGLYLDYCLDDIPAYASQREKQWEKAQKSDFLSINEKRRLVGYDDWEGGDVILIPATLLPLGMTVPEPEEQTEDEVEEDEKQMQSLLEEGYTREDALMLLGWKGDEKNDQSNK